MMCRHACLFSLQLVRLFTNHNPRASQFSRALLALNRKPNFHFISANSLTRILNVAHNRQYPTSFHHACSRILKSTSATIWYRIFSSTSIAMGDEVLKQFETLQIGSHQELSGGVYLPNEVSKSPDAKKIGHSIILPPEVINEPDAPNHVDSHQQPRLGSSRRRRKTRKQKEADVAQDVASNTPPSQFGEIPASTKQELHPPHYLFSQHPASPVATRSQSRRESQKASRFLPQNPRTKAQKADTTLLPHGQKFFSLVHCHLANYRNY